jgi:hypothetical protein
VRLEKTSWVDTPTPWGVPTQEGGMGGWKEVGWILDGTGGIHGVDHFWRYFFHLRNKQTRFWMEVGSLFYR